MPKEIFLVEDDTSIGSLVEAVFIGNGSNVSWYTSGTDALKHFNYGRFDICIFDLSLPDTDGIKLSKDIREIDPKIPFLFITANQEMQLKYQAFEAGCDDYVIKPFQIRELVLRVDAILRRVSGAHVVMPEFTDFSFDHNSRIITTKDKSIKLSTKEAHLFKLMFENFNNLVSRKQLMQDIWGNTDVYTSKSLDVYLSKMRKIIENETHFEILNEHGVGYKMINKNQA